LPPSEAPCPRLQGHRLEAAGLLAPGSSSSGTFPGLSLARVNRPSGRLRSRSRSQWRGPRRNLTGFPLGRRSPRRRRILASERRPLLEIHRRRHTGKMQPSTEARTSAPLRLGRFARGRQAMCGCYLVPGITFFRLTAKLMQKRSVQQGKIGSERPGFADLLS